MKEIYPDGMPKEVATDMLCANIPLSNRQRKIFRDARAKIFVSEQQPKLWTERVARKMAEASITQLSKWRGRILKRRRGVQNAYQKVQGQEDSSAKEKLLAALDLRAGLLDVNLDALDDVVGSRTKS